MRAFLVFLLAVTAHANAQRVLECDRYKVNGNTKLDRTIFRLAISADKTGVTYTKVSGKDWFLPTGSPLQPVWISGDGLRAVVNWVAKDYGSNKAQWSPVHILDIDFASPNFRDASYGGFADFSELVSSPWKHECKRLD
jgi:hypothetical protein